MAINEHFTIWRAMRGVDFEYYDLCREEALFEDPRSSSVASLLALGSEGMELDDSSMEAIGETMKDLIDTYEVTHECLQHVLQRHEPGLADDEDEEEDEDGDEA